jgi:diguanylate cyclase (GGDEF)-like protein/PAS domain S-box-containing protein
MNINAALQNEIFFSKVVELAADAILAIDKNMKLIYLNKEAEKMFGYSKDETIGQHLNMLIPPEFHAVHDTHIRKFLEENTVARLMNDRQNVEVKGIRKNGNQFFAEISIIKIQQEEEVILAAIIRDISTSKELEKKLRDFAEHDALTGIMNRRMTEDVLKKDIERASRYNKPLSLLMMDIDHFKRVNDTFGHDVGDLVLKHLTKISKSNLREVDSFGRWGGEEFVVLLPEIDLKGAHVVAEKLRKSIENTSLKINEDEKVSYTISIGGVAYSKSMKSWEAFFKLADNALYQAKEQGRNQVCMTST